MKYSTYRFTLDLQKHQSQISIAVFQYDTAVRLYISLTDGGIPYHIADGCRAIFYGKRPDGTDLVHPCAIEGNTRIIYDFNDQTACCEGTVDAQICLYGIDGELITAPRLIIVASARTVNPMNIDLQDNPLSALEQIVASETAREVAEAEREKAENGVFDDGLGYTFKGRVQAEAERVQAEAERVEAEKQRGREAQKWVTGSYVDENGDTQNVTSEDPQFNNNAKYYANSAQSSSVSAQTSASNAENYLTELKNVMVEPLKKRVDNIDYILEQFGTVVEERDSSSALVKSVPARSDLYAYLSEIGGRTERFNQRLILPTFNNPSYNGISTFFWQLAEGGSGTVSTEVSAVTKSGVTMINNGDGSFTFRGTATAQISFDLFSVGLSKASYSFEEKIQTFGIDNTISRYLSFGGVSLPAGVSVGVQRNSKDDEGGGIDTITGSGGKTTGNTWYKYIDDISLNVPSGTVFNNLTIKLMLNDGTSAMPWQSPNEPFEGLRSAKVREIKSYGENLFNAYKLVDNNKAYSTVVNQTTFAVTFNNIRYRIFSPKAGRYYFSAQSKRTGTKGGGVAVAIYNNAGSLVEPAKYWQESTLNPKCEFVLDGTEYELRIIFYGSLSDSVEETSIFKNVSLLLNTPTVTPTVSEIPASIQNLPNYGEGNPNDPTEYNAIDGENGVYIRRGGIVDGAWISETPTTTPINFDPLIPVEASGSIEVVTDNNQEVPTTFVYNIIQEA